MGFPERNFFYLNSGLIFFAVCHVLVRSSNRIRQFVFSFFQGQFSIPRIELYQDLAAFYKIRIIKIDSSDASRNLRHNLYLITCYIGVVCLLVMTQNDKPVSSIHRTRNEEE
ncbi:hypothetical protein XNC1_1311 [Xenorhabdus nematophila ATCC 19061]|uniref:Uncharacterized protein n=1 Tax=Xenorhabdus nematophila (strain ATCC 19061 / DSM 3370 / CCUG 14189 / LMG 1036 / NCIMB 9965 / AN6) TaxID=406817 RepID=D3V9Y8_XENNA|nr:hypothetical protein XNC1_1311 [Xenorhabdus nematophila ATCC 19061]